jgi:transposase
VEPTLNAVRIPQRRGRPRQRPRRLAADKGYSYPRIRRWLSRHKVKAVIPYRKNQRPDRGARLNGFDKDTYRRRHLIENCVGWLKECRRVATRYEKLALTYLAMLKLAMIQRYFVHLHLSDTA